MLALSFTNLVFISHISYIVLERKERFYQSKKFWLLLIGLLVSLLITFLYLPYLFWGYI